MVHLFVTKNGKNSTKAEKIEIFKNLQKQSFRIRDLKFYISKYTIYRYIFNKVKAAFVDIFFSCDVQKEVGPTRVTLFSHFDKNEIELRMRFFNFAQIHTVP